MKKSQLGVGFIGAGDVSILHGNAVTRNPDARLIGIWNRTRERGLQRARQFNCRLYETPEQLVSDPEIDTVFILTNPETHLYYAKMAFTAGKHVLCEKPVGGSVTEAEELHRAAQRAGLLCLPGHNMIYEESLARSHDLIAKGALGKLVSVYVLYNIWHSEERAATVPGIVRHILTHNSYTLIYLAGTPRRLSAFAASLHYLRLDKEDIAMVNLEMQNGALGHMCASFAADDLSTSPWAYTIKAIGTEGSTSYSYNDWVEARKGIAHSRTYTALQCTFDNELRQFIHSVRYGERPPSTLEDAILCQRIIEAIETSIAEGRAVDV